MEPSDSKNNSKNVYVVLVDSRGRSPSDRERYKELTTTREFFESHIHDNPNNIRVKSRVAELCGLDLQVYFHEHSHHHHPKDLPEDCTNGIATLLTFNPSKGSFDHIVRGKAYILQDNGKVPLSEERVWSLQDLIQEANLLYHENGSTYSAVSYNTLLSWCSKYQNERWFPKGTCDRRRTRKLDRGESGASDQATCHHGCVHIHHDGHHDCCRDPWGLENNDDFDLVKHHHVISFPKH